MVTEQCYNKFVSSFQELLTKKTKQKKNMVLFRTYPSYTVTGQVI